jgi:hypothetical protein
MEGIRTNGFFNQFSVVAKVAMIHKEGLAKFDYKLNIEVKLLKHSSIILAALLEPCKPSDFS